MDDGWTLLHTATQRKESDSIAKSLIENGAINIDQKEHCYGNTALHLAVYNERTAMVDRLLKAGAAADIQNYKLRTALYVAATEGHDEIAKLLFNAGAQAGIKDEFGDTAYDIAKRRSATAHEQRVKNYESIVNLLDFGMKLRTNTVSGLRKKNEDGGQSKQRKGRKQREIPTAPKCVRGTIRSGAAGKGDGRMGNSNKMARLSSLRKGSRQDRLIEM